MKALNLSGQRFGRLTALSREVHEKPSGQKYSAWLCLCDCGLKQIVRLGDLRSGNTKSCGCTPAKPRLTHGKTGSRTYRTWTEMRKRCYDKNNSAYANYGGRGITVCPGWQNSFENFLADMGEAPLGMSIERIDNSAGYSKRNCRWATVAEQARNRRSNIKITIDGRTQCLLDWCKEKGLSYATARARIKVLGWTPEQALTIPIGNMSPRRT